MMKVGDRVKIKDGKHRGKIGTIKTARETNGMPCFDVEIPKADRWYFYIWTELEAVPPTPTSPLADVNRGVRLAAERVVQNWKRGVTYPVLSADMQTLEKALLN